MTFKKAVNQLIIELRLFTKRGEQYERDDLLEAALRTVDFIEDLDNEILKTQPEVTFYEQMFDKISYWHKAAHLRYQAFHEYPLTDHPSYQVSRQELLETLPERMNRVDKLILAFSLMQFIEEQLLVKLIHSNPSKRRSLGSLSHIRNASALRIYLEAHPNLDSYIKLSQIVKRLVEEGFLKVLTTLEDITHDVDAFLNSETTPKNKIIWMDKATRSSGINTVSLFCFCCTMRPEWSQSICVQRIQRHTILMGEEAPRKKSSLNRSYNRYIQNYRFGNSRDLRLQLLLEILNHSNE